MNAVAPVDRQLDERARTASAFETTDNRVVDATAHAPQQITVLVDKSIGKQFLLIQWVSAVVTALAVIGLFMAWQGMRYNIAHTNVLQYDLMDLRAKTGHAHENTPEPDPQPEH